MRIHLTFLLFLVSGLFFGIPFFVTEFYWFTVIGFILLFFGIQKEKSHLWVFIGGCIAGLCLYLSTISWAWNTYPVKWISQDNFALQFFSIGTNWFVSATLLCLSVGFFSVCIKHLLSKTKLLLVIAPFLWVAHEVLSSFLFSIFVLGPGSALNVDFGYGYVGYLFANDAFFIQTWSFFGVYSMSYIVALLSVAAFVYFNKKFYTRTYARIVIIFGLLIYILFPLIVDTEYEKKGEKVIAVETYFDKNFESNENSVEVKRVAILEVVTRALKEDVDVLILPEESRLTDIFPSSEAVLLWIADQKPTFKGIIVDSGRTVDERDEIVMRAYLYDVSAGTYYVFDKQYLTPLGEYLPHVQKLIFSQFLSKETVETVEESLVYRQGVIHDSTMLPRNLPAVLFCFESISPFGVKKALEARHSDIVAHLISHTWFTNPNSLWSQLDHILTVQSVWNKVPIVSAGNMSENKLYLPSGEIETGTTLEEHELWSIVQFDI